MILDTCYVCGKQIEPIEAKCFADINIGACAAGAGNFKPFHSGCAPFSIPPFGPYDFHWQDGR